MYSRFPSKHFILKYSIFFSLCEFVYVFKFTTKSHAILTLVILANISILHSFSTVFPGKFWGNDGIIYSFASISNAKNTLVFVCITSLESLSETTSHVVISSTKYCVTFFKNLSTQKRKLYINLKIQLKIL